MVSICPSPIFDQRGILLSPLPSYEFLDMSYIKIGNKRAKNSEVEMSSLFEIQILVRKVIITPFLLDYLLRKWQKSKIWNFEKFFYKFFKVSATMVLWVRRHFGPKFLVGRIFEELNYSVVVKILQIFFFILWNFRGDDESHLMGWLMRQILE